MLTVRSGTVLLSLVLLPRVLVSQALSVQDSAGIRITVSPAIGTVPVRFTLADKPDVVIGGVRDDPADELNSNVSYPFALRLPEHRILVSEQDHWGVDERGKVTTIFRTRDVPLAMTAANLPKYSMECRPNPATRKCVPLPTKVTTWPAFRAFAVDPAEQSWFRLNAGASDSIWVGFDPTGRTVGKLLVPRDGTATSRRILEFGNGDVLLADYDDDGARRVSIYRIVPATRR